MVLAVRRLPRLSRRHFAGITDDLIRLSIGIERIDDFIADFFNPLNFVASALAATD